MVILSNSLLFKQGNLTLVAQDHGQMISESLWGWRLTTSLDNPCQSVIPCERVVADVHMSGSLPPVLSLGTANKSLPPSSVPPPFRSLYTLIKSPVSLLQVKQAQLPPTFPHRKDDLVPYLSQWIFPALLPYPSSTGEPALQGVPSPGQSRGEVSPPSTSWQGF